jgi:hypothetical protein
MSEIEDDLDYLADSPTLSLMEPINSNAMDFPPYPNKETVSPRSHCQWPSEVRSVKTVSDMSSSDRSYCWTSEVLLGSLEQGEILLGSLEQGEILLGNLEQALRKQKRPRPVKRARKPAVTTRRLGWKKPRDAPKRSLSAYNYFFREERKRVYAESDERAGFSELGKIIGQRWKSLTEDQRKPYDIMAEKEINRYREEMKLYEDARRRKFGRSLYRSPSSVTTASTLSNDTQCLSPDRVSSALHPVLESVRSHHHSAHQPPQSTVYAPQMIISNQHHNGGGRYIGQVQPQQYAQQQPQVQYAYVRMTRKKAQEYMRQAGGRH